MKQCSWSVRWCAAPFCLVAMLVLSACGSSQGVLSGASPTSQQSATATLAVPSQPVHFVAEDGAMLQGVLYGQGTQAVILSNEGNNESGLWFPIAQQLAHQGYLVLTYMYRDQGNSIDHLALHALTDLRAAMAFIRGQHVSKFALVGASLGALVSAKVATVDKLDAIVVISSPMGFQDVQLSESELHAMTTPKLFVTSEDNQPFTHDTLHMFDATPDPKEKLVYPGTQHGISLFEGDSGAALLQELLRFLQRYVKVS